MTRRIAWLGVAMMLCFAALFLQLNNIQVKNAHRYANDPANPRVSSQLNTQPRGQIQAADGTTVLAESVPNPAYPATSSYKYLREYPQGSLYSQIVGVDSPYYGLYGIENTYNSYLVSHNQPVKTLRDLLTTHTVDDTVTLTVQPRLQQAAAAALGGRNGAIVVIDPSTGAIEAMYSNPTYGPAPLASTEYKTASTAWLLDNLRDTAGFAAFTSLAYQNTFPPGSTFKTVTTAAAYDHAPQLVNKPQQSYSCIPVGTFQGQTTKPLCNYDSGTCGGTIAQMLPPSCDTGYALLGTEIGSLGMYDEATGFGFDQQPPIDLPHDAFEVSQFPTPAQVAHAQVLLAYSSIGQDLTVATPLQMALVAAGIANNGVVMTPHLMEEIYDSTGSLVSRYTPTAWKTATSPATAAALNGLMRQVVTNPHGTAAGVGFPPDLDVAAKTGTAQTGSSGTGSAGNSSTADWMIAFAPANAPQVALAVVVPNQALTATGAEISGPIMKQMIEAALAP